MAILPELKTNQRKYKKVNFSRANKLRGILQFFLSQQINNVKLYDILCAALAESKINF